MTFPSPITVSERLRPKHKRITLITYSLHIRRLCCYPESNKSIQTNSWDWAGFRKCYELSHLWTQASLIWYQENTAEEPRWSERRQGLLTALLCLVVHPVEIQTQLLIGHKDAFVLTSLIFHCGFWSEVTKTGLSTATQGKASAMKWPFFQAMEQTLDILPVWCFGWKSARCIPMFSHVVPWRRPQNHHNFHSQVESKYNFTLLQTLKSKLSFGMTDNSFQRDTNKQW